MKLIIYQNKMLVKSSPHEDLRENVLLIKDFLEKSQLEPYQWEAL